MNLSASVKNYMAGCQFLRRPENTLGGLNVVGNVTVKGQIWKKGRRKKEKKPERVSAWNAQKQLFFGGDFPTVTRPVIWGKCFKQSFFTRKCGFYFKTLPTTAMWKWNVALATRGTAAWESERVIKLTEGVIAQWLHFCWSCILFIRGRYYTNNGGLGIVLTIVISVLLNSRLGLTSAQSEFRPLKIGINH